MQINFFGAARTVTGSKHLLTLKNGKRILLDCGFFQGHGKDTDEMNRHFAFDPKEIDFLILSHAHIDHSGNIPNLVKQGFNGKIFCTPATKDLATIMLADTAHILETDIEYLNERREKKNQPPLSPIYSINDVVAALKLINPIPYDKAFEISPGVTLTFTDVGHILGAAAVNLEIIEDSKTTHLTFTGDIGRYTDKILPNPKPFPQADYILCESTYGNRLHPTAQDSEKMLLAIVTRTCVEQKGKLIIPAFSLGRTQEIVYALNNLRNSNKLPSIPVYVDSPLSINATNIMRAHPECFNDEIKTSLLSDADPFGFDTLHYIQKAEDSIALNGRRDPMIIISASGMAEAGRIKHHIKNAISDSRNTILIVGYCTPESLGGQLTAGNKEVHIFGKEYEVKASVEVMNSYSAHADYNEMLKYLSCQNASKVKTMFLVHGEYSVQKEWKEKLTGAGFNNIEIPEQEQGFTIGE